MVARYYSCYDVSDTKHGLGTVTFATPGHSSFTIDLSAVTATAGDGSTTSIFSTCDCSLSPVTAQDAAGTQQMAPLSALALWGRLTQLAIAGATSAGWPTPASWLIQFDNATNTWNFFTSDGFTAITFSNAQTRRFFGFSANYSGTLANLAVSDVYPYFLIVPTMLDVSAIGAMDALNYEPEGVSSQSVSGAGSVFGLSRTVVPMYRDWVQQFEVRAKTRRDSAVTAHPYTFQALFENARTGMPFLVRQGFGGTATEMFFLRAEASQWRPHPASDSANHALYHIDFKALVVGTVP